jgi:DNA-binding winged helix-turn-helix (wHTH) protein
LDRHRRLVEKRELGAHLWPDSFVEERTLARHVSDLRKALKDDRGELRYIETVPKRGYRFIARVQEMAAGADASPTPDVRVNARLLRASDGNVVWTEQFRRNGDRLVRDRGFHFDAPRRLACGHAAGR